MRCSPPSAVSTSLATQGKREGVGNGGQSGVSYSPAIGNLGANKHRIWGGGGKREGWAEGGGRCRVRAHDIMPQYHVKLKSHLHIFAKSCNQ